MRCEPWERLLIEVRDIVFFGDTRRVFAPRRVSIRYCYPFAIEASEDTHKLLDHQKKEDFSRHSGKKSIKHSRTRRCRLKSAKWARWNRPSFSPKAPDFTAACGWTSRRSSSGSSRGEEWIAYERGGLCRVWIVLSYMGKHCCGSSPNHWMHLSRICFTGRSIEAHQSALGARVFLAEPPDGKQVGWDNLQCFSRDVYPGRHRHAFLGHERKWPGHGPVVRGNLHEIVVVRTDDPLGNGTLEKRHPPRSDLCCGRAESS